MGMSKKTFCELCDNPYLSYVYKQKFEMEFSSDECNNNGADFLYDFINQFYESECLRVYPKMNKILSHMEKQKLWNNDDQRENHVLFQHGSIDYNAENNLLYKYNYLMEEKGQNLLNCMNDSKNFQNNQELLQSLDSILNKYQGILINSDMICHEKCRNAISKCRSSTELFKLHDDGSRFALCKC